MAEYVWRYTYFLDSILYFKVVTTTTPLHLGITSKVFELESWGCAQNEAFFMQITKRI